MKPGKINEYHCHKCGNMITTIDIHDGTTPFMMGCPKCKTMMTSRYYNVPQQVDAELMWYAPTLSQFQDDHVKQGGLIYMKTGLPLERVRLQNQPNEATCLITAFAMVLNVPVAELITQSGSDGMNVNFPDNPPPACYRGHHIQEMIFMCYERGYAVIEMQPIPIAQSGNMTIEYNSIDWQRCFEKILVFNNGVFVGKRLGKPHAVAWDAYRQGCYDSNEGTIYPIDKFEIRTFYAVKPLAKSNQKRKS